MTLTTVVDRLQPFFRWAPPWVFVLFVLGGALVAALAAHEIIVRLMRRGVSHRDAFWRSLVLRTRAPSRLLLVFIALSMAVSAAPLTRREEIVAQHLLAIAVIVLIGWALLAALDIGAAIYLRRYRVDVADNLLARKHLTQVRILRRAAATLIVLLTIAFALMTINQVRQWGVSLLAAGGAAGIFLGLALQPLLSNLMAGIQIATTQPIRIGDQVVVENESGTIEEITATYVVVRIWDDRRMVLPLTYFLQKPFQNWTRDKAQQTGAVMLYLDYTAPIAPMRAKLTELLEASPLWDRRVNGLQVTDAKDRVIEVRALMSADDPGKLFDLRCAVREQLIVWLLATSPHALPRNRNETLIAPERPASP